MKIRTVVKSILFVEVFMICFNFLYASDNPTKVIEKFLNKAASGKENIQYMVSLHFSGSFTTFRAGAASDSIPFAVWMQVPAFYRVEYTMPKVGRVISVITPDKGYVNSTKGLVFVEGEELKSKIASLRKKYFFILHRLFDGSEKLVLTSITEDFYEFTLGVYHDKVILRIDRKNELISRVSYEEEGRIVEVILENYKRFGKLLYPTYAKKVVDGITVDVVKVDKLEVYNTLFKNKFGIPGEKRDEK